MTNSTNNTPLVWSDFTKYDHLTVVEAAIQSAIDERKADAIAKANGANFGTFSV